MLALGANGRGRAGLLSALRPQDVFATSLYTVNGNVQSITTPFAPDFVWEKSRSTSDQHWLFDRVRGSGKTLQSNVAQAEATQSSGYAALSASGFTSGGYGPGTTAVAWSIKETPKFFDIVTYTGDGTSGRVIPHALGIDPGLIILRRRDAGDNWRVRHRSATGELYLNLTQAQDASFPSIPATSATNFTVGTNSNTSGGTYVAYLFAHDPDTTNGIVQCGSATSDGTGAINVNLGWPLQWILCRASSAAGNWIINDSTRGFSNSLLANTTSTEANGAFVVNPTATGFSQSGFNAGVTVIYCAIRAPI